MLVNGQGGIGKTTFAAKYWLEYQDEYTYLGVLYVGDGIAGALLQTEFTNNLGINFPEKITDEEKLRIVFDFLVTKLDKPCLLILDNANDAEDLGKYIVALSKCSNFHILLTSRLANFENTYPYALGALDKVAALKVFRENYKYYESTDETLFYEIFEAVGGNTLVMELLAKNLNNFNEPEIVYSLQNLYDNLQNSLLNLSKSKEVHTAYQAQGMGLRYEKTEVIILAMYDLSKLTENEIALLSVFAVLPPENIAFATLKTLIDSEILNDSLGSLKQKGWIEFDKTTKSYKVSPVVQEITRYKNKERLFGDCKGMIDFLVDGLHWNNSIDYDKNNYKLTILYSHYAENIASIFLNNTYKIALLFERIAVFYKNIGNINRELENLNKAYQIYKNRLNQNPENLVYKYNLAVLYSKLGDTHKFLDKLDVSLSFFENFNNLMQELYKIDSNNLNFKNGVAVSYSKLGSNYRLLGNLEKALTFYEKFNQFSKELYETSSTKEFKNGLALSYQFLGITYLRLGDLDKALLYFEQFNQFEEELCNDYPNNNEFKNLLAISYEKLGEIYSIWGNLDKALYFFEKRNNLGKKLYEHLPAKVDLKNSLAISYQHLGNIYSSLRKYEHALSSYYEMNKLYEELYKVYSTNMSFKNGLAISYEKLGDIHNNLGNFDKILLFYEERKKLGEELCNTFPDHVAYKNNLAISYGKLGDFYQKKDKQKAKIYYLESQKLLLDLVQKSPYDVEFQNNLKEVESKLASL
jgi:tetratricopeptide (TPR) repeat protein